MAERKMRYIAQRQAGEPYSPDGESPEGDAKGGENAADGTDGAAGGRVSAANGAGDGGSTANGADSAENGWDASRMRRGSGKGSEEIWVRKEYVLFDLDGTLTDPKMGITKCVQYALASFGIEEPDLDKLEPFIGPPLKDSFKQFYGFDDEKAEAAVAKYRERFQDTGIFENEIYRGVPEMLKKLRMRGLHLAVASSKPTVFVEKILEHFKIRSYFEVVVGSELDGTRSQKAEVVREALRRLFHGGTVQRHKVFMVGDRKFDVEGAREAGVESVGVSFGYGSMEELMEAHADYIVRSVEELRRFLLRGFEDMDKDLGNFQKTWILVSQFILFVAARGLARNLCLLLLEFNGVENPSDDVVTLILGIGFIAGGLAIFKAAKGCIRRTIQDMYLTHLKPEPKSAYAVLALATPTLGLGVAQLLTLSGFAGGSEQFQMISQAQAHASLWAAFITYGLISPLAEELLFRGTIYGYIRKFFDVKTAIIASAILFGIYHGNMVLAVNATVMGYFIAYAYEYFGDFKVPVLMHVGYNVLSLLVQYFGLGNTKFVSWPACIGFLVVGCACVIWLARRKRVA